MALVSAEGAWHEYRGRALGLDLRVLYPPQWSKHIDALAAMLLWVDGPLPSPEALQSGQMPVPPLNIEKQPLANMSIEQFSELSLKQLREMFQLKDVPKAVTLVINGAKWTKTKYTANVPGTPFPIDCEQFWCQKGREVFIVTLSARSLQSAADALKESHRKVVNRVMESLELGDARQEHLNLRHNHVALHTGDSNGGAHASSIRSLGLLLPPSWTLESPPDVHSGHLGTYVYRDEFTTLQASLFVERSARALTLDQLAASLAWQFEKALVDKALHVPSDALLTTAALPARALSLPLPLNGAGDNVNRLLVVFAPLPASAQREVLYCHFKYSSHDGKAVRQLEDMGRSVFRMIELNPTSATDDGLVTYLNLTWGFGFKYDASKYRPAPAGSTVRLMPRHSLPQLPSSGEPAGIFSPMFKDITPNQEDDLSVEAFAQKTRELIQSNSPGRYEVDDRKATLGGFLAAKNIVLIGNEKILTYFTRTPENKWYPRLPLCLTKGLSVSCLFIVRWHTFESDFETNRKTIEGTFNSFFFFNPDA